MGYIEIPVDISYRLVNHGPVVLVSSRSPGGRYDIAPVAWNCPVGKSPPRILIAVGRSHATFENISSRGEFAVSVPCLGQEKLVRETGSVSGRDSDKFSEMNIEYTAGEKTDTRIPLGCSGYIECSLSETFETGKVALFIGDALAAAADPEAFSERIRPESEKGRTLHHLGGKVFALPSEKLSTV